MLAAYLWFNALLYAVFAIWCTVRDQATARGLGYLVLDNGGRSEYLTVYGGLQAGLALAFAYTAFHPAQQRTGLLLALALYAPIVVFRWASIFTHAPTGRTTLLVGVLETTLLVVGLALWRWSAR